MMGLKRQASCPTINGSELQKAVDDGYKVHSAQETFPGKGLGAVQLASSA